MNPASRAAIKISLAFSLAAIGISFPALEVSAQSAPSALPSASAQPNNAASIAPAGSASPAPSATPKGTEKIMRAPLAPAEGVDALSDAEALQALQALKANYLDHSAFAEDAINRATLQGLLSRLGSGAILEKQLEKVVPESPFRAEILDDRIGYARLGALTKDHLGEFDSALGNFATKNLAALIIDLRATPASNDYEVTAEYLKRLAPKGKLLFTIHRPSAKQEQIYTSNQDPTFRGILVTLVDANTAGGGEVIAGALRGLNNALVVGQNSAGQAAEFKEIPLLNGRFLRLAVAEVKVSSDIAIFPKGIKPDLSVSVSARDTEIVLNLGLEHGVSGLVYESERPRFNEAALVAGINPELDEYEAAQRSGTVGQKKRGVTDVALQRAVDLITTLEIFGKAATNTGS